MTMSGDTPLLRDTRPGAAFLAYAEALLAFLVTQQVATALLFATGAGLAFPSAIVIALLGVIAAAALCRLRLPADQAWRVFASTMATIAACLFTAAQVYDVSWDGQTYHQPAVIALAGGWNPIWKPFSDNMLGSEGLGIDSHLWIQHYPKGGWIIQAVLYRATGSLQAAKGINIVAACAAFAAVGGVALRLGLTRVAAIAIALAAACNPVMITQALTFYNDGLAGSLLTVLAAALAMLVMRNDRRDWPMAILALVLVANLKFSILVIAVIFCLAGALALILRHRRRSLPTIATLMIAGIVAVLLVGWAPYVGNMVGWGHPFYPVMGSKPADIMAFNTPAEFTRLARLPRFILGTFGHRTPEWTISLIPHVDLKAIAASGFADARIGGFGIFFPFIAAISALGLLLLLLSDAMSRTGKAWLSFALTAIVASILVHPENWWARYVPQLWLMPVAIAIAALALPHVRRLRWLGTALLVLLLLDAGASGMGALRFCYNGNHAIVAERDHIRRDMNGAIIASVGYWLGPVHRLRQEGIRVTLVPRFADLPCSDPKPLATSGGYTRYCPAPR